MLKSLLLLLDLVRDVLVPNDSEKARLKSAASASLLVRVVGPPRIAASRSNGCMPALKPKSAIPARPGSPASPAWIPTRF